MGRVREGWREFVRGGGEFVIGGKSLSEVGRVCQRWGRVRDRWEEFVRGGKSLLEVG